MSYADSLVVMPLAMVVAAGVAVNDGAVEEHRQYLLHGKIGSTSVDADAFILHKKFFLDFSYICNQKHSNRDI